MSNIPMQGLAEQLRKLCRTANPEACEIYGRWATEVEAAQAALAVPAPKVEAEGTVPVGVDLPDGGQR